MLGYVAYIFIHGIAADAFYTTGEIHVGKADDGDYVGRKFAGDAKKKMSSYVSIGLINVAKYLLHESTFLGKFDFDWLVSF